MVEKKKEKIKIITIKNIYFSFEKNISLYNQTNEPIK
jgi:hypothetical protein